MIGVNVLGLLIFPIILTIPILILYFVIKLTVKNALHELTQENNNSL